MSTTTSTPNDDYPLNALLPLQVVMRHVYQGQRIPDRTTILRWIHDGLCGVKLPAVPQGKRYLTTLGDYLRWQEEVRLEAKLSAGERGKEETQQENEADRKRRAAESLERIKRM